MHIRVLWRGFHSSVCYMLQIRCWFSFKQYLLGKNTFCVPSSYITEKNVDLPHANTQPQELTQKICKRRQLNSRFEKALWTTLQGTLEQHISLSFDWKRWSKITYIKNKQTKKPTTPKPFLLFTHSKNLLKCFFAKHGLDLKAQFPFFSIKWQKILAKLCKEIQLLL